MNTALPSLADPRRPSWWALVGRWLLLLLVAFDLISSPFHAHTHDAGGSGDFHAAHASVDLDHEDETHIEAPDAHTGFGHALSALLPAEMPRLSQQTLLGWFTAPPPAPMQAAVVMASMGWTAAPEHIPIPDGVHWRPIGRAPPSLHA